MLKWDSAWALLVTKLMGAVMYIITNWRGKYYSDYLLTMRMEINNKYNICKWIKRSAQWGINFLSFFMSQTESPTYMTVEKWSVGGWFSVDCKLSRTCKRFNTDQCNGTCYPYVFLHGLKTSWEFPYKSGRPALISPSRQERKQKLYPPREKSWDHRLLLQRTLSSLGQSMSPAWSQILAATELIFSFPLSSGAACG